MMRTKRVLLITIVLFLGFTLSSGLTAWAQPKTHRVVKGDTLWDICEKYYGDPNLWPQLWELNPFITNPHLLKPGDVVTLFEEVPAKRPEVAEEKVEEKVPEKKVEPAPPPAVAAVSGVDISGLTNVHALGYLSVKEVEPWGHVFSSESSRLLLSPNDTVFLKFHKGKVVKPGDEFNICQSSPLIKHPVTGEKMGYLLSVRGRAVVEKPVGVGFGGGEYYKTEGIYRAKIVELYTDLNVGDLVLPHEPISACVEPKPMEKPLIGNIVATQDEMDLIAVNTVVYLDQGFNNGVRRGNVFEVVRPNIVPDPERRWEWLTNQARIILPDVPMGTVMVVESRPTTATAIVLSAREDFGSGAYIKGLSWVETPEPVSRIPSCTSQ